MKRRATLAAALATTLFAASSCALADPEETDSGAAARDPDYAAGKLAIERKDWKAAAEHLGKAALRDPGNADLQNYLGYSYRNQRRYDLAFDHYKRALKLDPRHKGAHEYIGETYLRVGDRQGAEKHLAELRKLCPLGCEQLFDLEKALAEFAKK